MVAVSADQLRDDAQRFFREETPPRSFAWVEALSPVSYRLFIVELADALKRLAITGDLTEFVVLVGGWEATAELERSPEILAEVLRPKQYRPLEWFTG